MSLTILIFSGHHVEKKLFLTFVQLLCEAAHRAARRNLVFPCMRKMSLEFSGCGPFGPLRRFGSFQIPEIE